MNLSLKSQSALATSQKPLHRADFITVLVKWIFSKQIIPIPPFLTPFVSLLFSTKMLGDAQLRKLKFPKLKYSSNRFQSVF